jgi:hypothetical protein
MIPIDLEAKGLNIKLLHLLDIEDPKDWDPLRRMSGASAHLTNFGFNESLA